MAKPKEEFPTFDSAARRSAELVRQETWGFLLAHFALRAMLAELRAEVVSSSRGRAVPRGVKRKMGRFPLRPRRRQPTRTVDNRVRTLK